MTAAPPGSRLTPLEIASGLVLGTEPADASGSIEPQAPLAVLEAAVLPALERPPCLVSFSGGRDSSSVLALAVTIARREGLRPPVPVTLRFPGIEEADETEWQERVVAYLRLDDWLRHEPGDDLDAIGPVATRVLERHGLLWPFNTYVHAPLLEDARGGSLLTGVGGDELFERAASDRVSALLARRARPKPRDILRVGLAAAPWRVRRRVLERRSPLRLTWLRPVAQRALAREWATEAAHEPRRLGRRAAWWPRQRTLRVAVRSLGTLAAEEDVHIAHPLTAPGLAAAILRDREFAFADRKGRLRGVFGGLLPDELYARRSKASFNRAFFGAHARAFVEAWDGQGVDAEFVDVDALRAVWHEEIPDGRSYLLLQSVWLEHVHRVTAATRGGASPTPPATTSHEDVAARTPAERQA